MSTNSKPDVQALIGRIENHFLKDANFDDAMTVQLLVDAARALSALSSGTKTKDVDPPEAPIHYERGEASAWQVGWSTGRDSARASETETIWEYGVRYDNFQGWEQGMDSQEVAVLRMVEKMGDKLIRRTQMHEVPAGEWEVVK